MKDLKVLSTTVTKYFDGSMVCTEIGYEVRGQFEDTRYKIVERIFNFRKHL